jgi:hypothetical protein
MIEIFNEFFNDEMINQLERLLLVKDEIRDPYVYQIVLEYEYQKDLKRIGSYD